MNRYLQSLFLDAGLVELRHKTDHWKSYWFDNAADLQSKAHVLGESGNLYASLNRPKLRVLPNSKPIRNEDVQWIVRIPFDFDPERPTDTCSTEAELADAKIRCNALVLRLHKTGWPIPLIGMSGNGYHAQYRGRLPANDETAEHLKLIYRGLKSECDDDVVRFDTSVRNPGRIFRLYGTVNRKGPDTPDRPHRKSTCVIPQQWRQVTQRQVDQLAHSFARQEPERRESTPRPYINGRGDYSTLDVVRWFQSHGLYVGHIENHLHEVHCPWEDEHSSSTRGDTVVFETDGSWAGFDCKHAHCEGRSIRDVISLWGDADQFCNRRVAS